MDEELSELVPVFVAEARERLQRLVDLAPASASSEPALVELKRELHTLKGAGRMMALAPFAEVCHAAEEVVLARSPRLGELLIAVHDALSAMVDAVEGGSDPERARALVAQLDRAARSGGAAAPAERSAATAPRVAAAVAPPVAAEAAPPDERLDPAGLDAFAERAVRVRAAAVVAGRLLARLDELARLAEDGVRDPQPAQALAVVAASLRQAVAETGALETRLARTGEEQIDAVLTLQIAPLKPTLRSLARYARDLARGLGRELEVELAGETTRLDRRIARELDGALRHLVANAVDHGVEPAAEREAAGKPARGRLRIEARAAGRGVELELADDGRGVDAAAVVEQAVSAGLVPRVAAETLPEAEALRLLFLPGFSTRSAASEVSGRGVGLDAVEAAVSRLGGEVRMTSAPGRGTAVVLDLPIARRGEQALVVRVGGRRIAVPAVVVRRVAGLAGVAIEERGGHRLAILGERLVPFVPLAEALGFAAEGEDLLIEGSVAGRPVAFAVERVEGEVELLVRPLPRRARVSALIDGAALLPSGEPIAVLAPQALLGREAISRRAPLAAPQLAAREAPRLLLVDDSRVTREMERRILEDAGFRVEIASDGDEAMRRLAAESFDCLVTDIEMPGLDGFALTEELRRVERFARLPIVVVSTRERPEDRLRGLRAGADAYLTKQSLVAADLVDTVRRLTGG
ncbi:MAG TPA: response regulator [Thermoanaerobaculia bacterium]|nr:response regulator [Thermoanaerobaculia bacterium]